MGLFDLDFHVTNLEPSSFEHVVNSTLAGFWIIMMYAPWCGHCQQFAPKWSKVSVFCARGRTNADGTDTALLPLLQVAKWLADDERVHVGAIDCIKYSKTCNEAPETRTCPDCNTQYCC